MKNQKRLYAVCDTNILLDYPNLIPEDGCEPPEGATIDLSRAHIIIPTVVVRELSNFKKEQSERGRTSCLVLKRLRALFENCGATFEQIMELEAPVSCKNRDQIFSIFPSVLQKACKRQQLDFEPSQNDMDGQIILVALFLAKKGARHNLRIWSWLRRLIATLFLAKKGTCYNDQLIVVTNDNGLATRAAARGLKSTRYGYKLPPVYSGRRDLVVPDDLLREFLDSRDGIELECWEEAMPNEPPLVANEFLIMLTENEELDAYSGFYRNIGRYDVKSKRIVHLRYFDSLPVEVRNAGQAIYLEALCHPEIDAVICTGPAGSGKTYLATVFCLESCRAGNYIGTAVVPCGINNQRIGALPGDLDQKMDPSVQPIKNALQNYLIKTDKSIRRQIDNLQKFGLGKEKKPKNNKKGKKNQDDCQDNERCRPKSIKNRLDDKVELLWENWFGEPIPIEYARGRDFAYQIAFYDEFQDQSRSEADMLAKRLGEAGKILITGDIEQIHSEYLDSENNGLVFIRELLKDYSTVAQVTFREEEVERHPLVREIVRRQQQNRSLRP